MAGNSAQWERPHLCKEKPNSKFRHDAASESSMKATEKWNSMQIMIRNSNNQKIFISPWSIYFLNQPYDFSGNVRVSRESLNKMSKLRKLVLQAQGKNRNMNTEAGKKIEGKRLIL